MQNKVVYAHKRKDTGSVFYIGAGTKRRPNDKSMRTEEWHRVVSSFGYEVEVLISGLSASEMCSWEVYLIGLYGRADKGNGPLVNKTDGGVGCNGVIIPDSLREASRKRMSGRKMSDESKAKLSASRIGKYSGENSYAFGKKLSEDVKQKISKSHKGRAKSKEHIEKISASLKGRFGRGNCYSSRRVIDTITGNVFSCIIDAADSIGMKPSTLRCQLRGDNRNKTNFIYYEDFQRPDINAN